MFKFVHHVDYAVRSRDDIVAFMERNFGMKPDKLLDDDTGRWKEAHYYVGPTLIRFREPGPDHKYVQFLERHGPGVNHVAWAVENIAGVAEEFTAKGITQLGRAGIEPEDERGFHRNTITNEPFNIINIDPKHSHGVFFQLAE